MKFARVRALLAAAAMLLAGCSAAPAQQVPLQAGPWVAGHVMMYSGSGGAQPIVQDAGSSAGGATGANISELGITARGTGTAPYDAQGNGPNGEIVCTYDGPTTGPHHYLCMSPNVDDGGLISYGAAGGAAEQDLYVEVNGVRSQYGQPIGVLPIANGGTGQTTANGALNALLPSQTGNAGKALITDGSNASWSAVAGTGTVTSVTCGAGLTGGVITTVGTCAIDQFSGATTLYVGANIPAPTITLASPAVVTSNSHGMSVGAPVVFNVPLNTKIATITEATPGVVTLANHGYTAGRPIKFTSSGKLPAGITDGTTYYVIAAGLTASTFQFSATPGGGAVSTVAPSFTVTIASPAVFTQVAHGYTLGQPLVFATTGSLPTGLTAGTTYYVIAAGLTADNFRVSTTPSGSAVNTSGGQSGTHTSVQNGAHYLSTTGSLPTGISEGTTYYVISPGFTTNSFEISATPGGAAVNTTGPISGSPVYGAYTGNDTNTGLAQTPGGALLTLQKAYDKTQQIPNPTGATLTVQIADGTYNLGFQSFPFGYKNGVTFQGNSSVWANVLISPTTSDCVRNLGGGQLVLRDLKCVNTSGGSGVYTSSFATTNLQGVIEFGEIDFVQTWSNQQGLIIDTATRTIYSGDSLLGLYATFGGTTEFLNPFVFLGLPTYGLAFAQADAGMQSWQGSTPSGGAFVGFQYNASNGGLISTGMGSSFFPGTSGGSAATGYYN